jgi:hypothetical protein
VIPFFQLFINNKWMRYALAAVLVVAALLYVRHYFVELGKDQGREEVKQTSKEQIQAALSAERTSTATEIAKHDADAAAARARADAFETAAAQLADINKTLISQRAAVSGKVNATPDSELHPAVIGALGLRSPNDTTPGYYPVEERSIYSCVLDRPLCEQSVKNQGQQVEKLTSAVSELKTQVTEQGAKYDALRHYTGTLETGYTAIYNLYPKTYRSAKCIWFCKKPIVLPVPKPEDLMKGKP